MAESEPAPEDDVFWLQRAGSIVTGTAETLDTAARRIADAMAWFWTAYAAVSIAVVSFNTDVVGGVAGAITLALPAVLIFAAYLSATFASLPVQVTFDDRIPESIKAAHDLAMHRKKNRITAAAILAAIAACAVAVAVSFGALNRDAEPIEGTAVFELDEESGQALIGGRLTVGDRVTVFLTDPRGAVTRQVVPVADSEWHTSIDVDLPGVYEARVSWVLDDIEYSVEKELSLR